MAHGTVDSIQAPKLLTIRAVRTGMSELNEKDGGLRRSEAGLTLIELMVVVAIIGILSATAMAAYGSYRNRGYEAVAIAYLRNWVPAQEAHYQRYGYYADADEQLERPLNILRVPRDVPYDFSIDSPSRARRGWFGRARPREGGLRHFYVNETGIVRSSLSGPVIPP